MEQIYRLGAEDLTAAVAKYIGQPVKNLEVRYYGGQAKSKCLVEVTVKNVEPEAKILPVDTMAQPEPPKKKKRGVEDPKSFRDANGFELFLWPSGRVQYVKNVAPTKAQAAADQIGVLMKRGVSAFDAAAKAGWKVSTR